MIYSKRSTTVKISLKEAIRKTTHWRKFLKDVLKEKHAKRLTKGVYISKEDIEALGKICANDEAIIGVRAYFTLEHAHVHWPYDNAVKFIMVPVRYSEEHKHGKDIPVEPGGSADNLDDSNVYDFTMPCPDCCDTTSVLYGPQVNGDGEEEG